MNRDILDELAVPPPPYRAWRATLATAPKEEPKKESPPAQGLGTIKAALEKGEIKKGPTPAEASVEISAAVRDGAAEILAMPGVPEEKKQAAIAQLNEVLRLQLAENAKMSETETEKKLDTSEPPKKEEVSKTDSAEYYKKLLSNEKDEAKQKDLQRIIDSYLPKKASPSSSLRSPPFHEIDKPTAEDIEDAKLDARRLVSKIKQSTPEPVPQPVPEPKESEPTKEEQKIKRASAQGSKVGDIVVAGNNKARVLEVDATGRPTRLDTALETAPAAIQELQEDEEALDRAAGEGMTAVTPPALARNSLDKVMLQPPKNASKKEAKKDAAEERRQAADALRSMNPPFGRGAEQVTMAPGGEPEVVERGTPDAEKPTPHVAEDLKHQEQLAARRVRDAQNRQLKKEASQAQNRQVAEARAKELRAAGDNETADFLEKGLGKKPADTSTDTQPFRPTADATPDFDMEFKEPESPPAKPMSRREFLGLPKTEAPVAAEAAPSVAAKPTEKAPEPAAPERPRFNTGRELVKSVWEGTGIGLKSETFWGRWMANLNDAAANYWLGPVLRGKARLEKYQDKAKDFEEKMKDSNFQFTRDWYRKRMVKAQQRATMAEGKLGVYKMKKEIYDSRRADYCRQVALKYETYTEPYEARIRGAQEIIKQKVALEDGLVKSHKEQLARISELNLNAKTSWGGLVKDRKSVRDIKAAEKILQGIAKKLDRSQKARFKQQGEIARFTSRVAPWKARRKSILEFAIT